MQGRLGRPRRLGERQGLSGRRVVTVWRVVTGWVSRGRNGLCGERYWARRDVAGRREGRLCGIGWCGMCWVLWEVLWFAARRGGLCSEWCGGSRGSGRAQKEWRGTLVRGRLLCVRGGPRRAWRRQHDRRGLHRVMRRTARRRQGASGKGGDGYRWRSRTNGRACDKRRDSAGLQRGLVATQGRGSSRRSVRPCSARARTRGGRRLTTEDRLKQTSTQTSDRAANQPTNQASKQPTNQPSNHTTKQPTNQNF